MSRGFPWDDAELKRRASAAVAAIWSTRAELANAQVQAGLAANDSRGGRHLDAFAALMGDLAREAGFGSDEVRFRTGVEIPGFYRPTKRWDLVIVRGDRLCAAIEFKSMMTAYGKNLNNRTEEALGSASDVWAAFKEGTLGNRAPWLGYLFVIREEAESLEPVSIARSTPPAERAFEGTSYLDRYGILCSRMVRERLYTAAAYVASRGPEPDAWREPKEGLELRTFAHSFYGHLLGWS